MRHEDLSKTQNTCFDITPCNSDPFSNIYSRPIMQNTE